MKNWEFNLKAKKQDLPEPIGYFSKFNQEVIFIIYFINKRLLKMKSNHNQK